MKTHQGDICNLKNKKTNETGWYQKLRCDKNVCYVNINNTQEKIPNDEVGENEWNKERMYKVIYVISGENVIKANNIGFDKYSKETVYADYQIEEVEKEILSLTKIIKDNNIQIQKYEQCLKTNAEAFCYINEYKDAIKRIKKSGAILITYVYGKHENCEKEFCWALVDNFDVKVGDVIEVETVHGNAIAHVTRIEQSYELNKHKRVIRKI